MPGPLQTRKPLGSLPRRCANSKVVCQNPAEKPAVDLRKPALERGCLFPGCPLFRLISSEQYSHARLVGGLSLRVLSAWCDGLDSVGDATTDLSPWTFGEFYFLVYEMRDEPDDVSEHVVLTCSDPTTCPSGSFTHRTDYSDVCDSPLECPSLNGLIC